MKWNASVTMTVSIDYDDIEADSKEDAERIAKEMAEEDIDYNNCDADVDSLYASCWENKESEKEDI